MKDVAVIRTGTANLASVLAGLRRAQCKPVLVDDPKMVTSADYVVLPGVGAFAAIMDQLRSRRLVAAIERGPILACQFHPELSGKWGASLIERWLGVKRETESC